MPTLKYSELLGLNGGLNKISELSQKENSKVSFRLSVQVATLAKSLQEHLETYDKKRADLINKYAKPVYQKSKDKFNKDGTPQFENSGQFNFETTKNTEAFNKELQELLETDVNFNTMFKFEMKDLESLSSYGFGVPEVNSLLPLIKDIDSYYFEENTEEVK